MFALNPGWCGSVTECWPVTHKVTGLVPSQGACLGCGTGLQLGVSEKQPTDVSLAHVSVSFPVFLLPFLSLLSLSKEKKKEVALKKEISVFSIYCSQLSYLRTKVKLCNVFRVILHFI